MTSFQVMEPLGPALICYGQQEAQFVGWLGVADAIGHSCCGGGRSPGQSAAGTSRQL